MKIMHHITTAVILIISISSCGILKEQYAYIAGLKIPNQKSELILLEDLDLTQIRGKIKTEYYAYLEKGVYELALESDSGFFYLAFAPNFICELSELGGIFVPKNSLSSIYLWTTPVLNQDKFILGITQPDYVKRLLKMDNTNKPFVHTNYTIKREDFEFK